MTALRPAIAILLIALIAGNAMAGSFSGMVHSHALDEAGVHHHDHDDDHHDHDHEGDGNSPAGETDGLVLTDDHGGADQKQLHGHGPQIVIGPVPVVELALLPVREWWAPTTHHYLILDRRLSSERPPRAA